MKKILIKTVACLLAAMLASGFFACNQSLVQLDAPQNLRIKGRTLVWDDVKNASGYNVVINSEEYISDQSSYDLSELDAPGVYEIKVSAAGAGIYSDSIWKTYIYMAQEILASGKDETGYEYTLMPDESGYIVSQGDAPETAVMTIPDYFCGLPVKIIDDGAFDNMEQIDMGGLIINVPGENNTVTQTLVLPACLEEIGASAFAGMTALKNVEIPDTVKKIGKGAFSSCTSLTKLRLPASLETVDYWAVDSRWFGGLIIPEVIALTDWTIINDDMNGIAAVYYEGTQEQWDALMEKAEVPFSMTLTYVSYYSETQPASSGNFWHYVDGEPVRWAQA